MNQPMTPTTPEQLAESVRGALEIYDGIVAGGTLVPTPDMERDARESADHLRMLFPDLGDATIAGFVSYVFVNLAMMYRQNPFSSVDLLAAALTYGQVLKQFAWSVTTPDGGSPNEAS